MNALLDPQAVKLSIIIPFYNEEPTIQAVVDRVLSVSYEKEIILVDDGSTDNGASIAGALAHRHDEVTLKRHERNLGKGAALRTAFGAITGDIVVIQDADLEYDPADYAVLLEPILADRADVVYGSRFLGGSHRVLLFWHYVGNRAITLLSNIFSNLNLTDIETGYKAFRASILADLTFRSNRFGFEPEFTAKVARARLRIYEVPINYHGRSYAEGKKITWKDGVVAVVTILRYGIFG